MVDTTRLRAEIQNFVFYNKFADPSAPCKAGDINNVIDGLVTLLNAFVDELEMDERM